jgi:hypothetical protein
VRHVRPRSSGRARAGPATWGRADGAGWRPQRSSGRSSTGRAGSCGTRRVGRGPRCRGRSRPRRRRPHPVAAALIPAAPHMVVAACCAVSPGVPPYGARIGPAGPAEAENWAGGPRLLVAYTYKVASNAGFSKVASNAGFSMWLLLFLHVAVPPRRPNRRRSRRRRRAGVPALARLACGEMGGGGGELRRRLCGDTGQGESRTRGGDTCAVLAAAAGPGEYPPPTPTPLAQVSSIGLHPDAS